MGPQRMFGMTPWVRRLIVANLIVFLLQMTIFVNPWFVTTFGFTPLDAWARLWTFGTYMFLHANVLHLAVNMLGLFVFGTPVEERMGGAPFLAYYVLFGLGGAAGGCALGGPPRGGGRGGGRPRRRPAGGAGRRGGGWPARPQGPRRGGGRAPPPPRERPWPKWAVRCPPPCARRRRTRQRVE